MATERKPLPPRMRAVFGGALAAAAVTTALGASPGVRSIFLNGVDISAARSQELKNVDVRINESGDVFIVAPHYQVNEEDTYVPLSKYAEGLKLPKHKAPQAVGETLNVGPGTPIATSPIPKAGEPMSPPAEGQTVNAGGAGGEGAAKTEDPPPPALPGDESGAAPVQTSGGGAQPP
jgi:hypothetical protein